MGGWRPEGCGHHHRHTDLATAGTSLRGLPREAQATRPHRVTFAKCSFSSHFHLCCPLNLTSNQSRHYESHVMEGGEKQNETQGDSAEHPAGESVQGWADRVVEWHPGLQRGQPRGHGVFTSIRLAMQGSHPAGKDSGFSSAPWIPPTFLFRWVLLFCSVPHLNLCPRF